MADSAAQARDPDALRSLMPDGELDVAQAEAWASAVIGAVDRIDLVVDWLEAERPDGVMTVLAALAAVGDDAVAGRAGAAHERLVKGGVRPAPEVSAAGTAVPIDARLISTEEGVVVAVRWVHDDGTMHTMLNELDGPRIRAVRFAGGDLFELIEPERAQRAVILDEISLDAARSRIAAGLEHPVRADDETWANAALARKRFSALGIEVPARFTPPATTFPGVDPDPDTATYSISVLRSALGPTTGALTDDIDRDLIDALLSRIRPVVVTAADEDEARAVAHLEWADWLGAVIGLVRAGVGAPARPVDLVDHINRCPEVTTTIPRSDADHVAACFAVAMARWEELGLTTDGMLTSDGRRVLPRALAAAARREGATVADT